MYHYLGVLRSLNAQFKLMVIRMTSVQRETTLHITMAHAMRITCGRVQ